MRRLSQEKTRKRIAEETDANLANGWHNIFIASASDNSLVGRTIDELAVDRGVAGVDAALDVLTAQRGAVLIVSFNQSDENLRKVLTHPLTSIVTDGLMTEGKPHPRTYGTYPTLFGEFVREKRWFTLEEAVRKSTSVPAGRFDLDRRGRIAAGNWADLTVFDPHTIGSNTDYMNPRQRPQGIVHVMVNGRWALRDGHVLDEFPGRALRR